MILLFCFYLFILFSVFWKKIITKRRTIPMTTVIIDAIQICLISISNQHDKTVVQYDFNVPITNIISPTYSGVWFFFFMYTFRLSFSQFGQQTSDLLPTTYQPHIIRIIHISLQYNIINR